MLCKWLLYTVCAQHMHFAMLVIFPSLRRPLTNFLRCCYPVEFECLGLKENSTTSLLPHRPSIGNTIWLKSPTSKDCAVLHSIIDFKVFVTNHNHHPGEWQLCPIIVEQKTNQVLQNKMNKKNLTIMVLNFFNEIWQHNKLLISCHIPLVRKDHKGRSTQIKARHCLWQLLLARHQPILSSHFITKPEIW